MFGRRSNLDEALLEWPAVAELQRSARRILKPLDTKPPDAVVTEKPQEGRKTDEYYDLKRQVFGVHRPTLQTIVDQVAVLQHQRCTGK